MTQYLSTVLRALERIYRFRSSQRTAPDELELEVPIQVVHDVSRMAQYGTGVGTQSFGYWLSHFQNVHTIVGTLTGTQLLHAPTNALNGYPATFDTEQFQAWIIRGWADTTDAGDTTGGMINLVHSTLSIGPTGSAAAQSANDIVMMADTESSAGLADGSGRPMIQSNEPSTWLHHAIPLLQNSGASSSIIKYTSVVAGAGTATVDFNVLFWLGRKGATPPGFA